MCPPTDPRRSAARGRIPRRIRRGFTLVELLASLVLLTLVLTMVYGAFGQISSAAITLRDEMTERQELRLLARLIADDLQAALWLDRYGEKGVEFRSGIVADTTLEDGKEYTDISFHAARPTRFFRTVSPERDPGLHEIGYRVERSEDRDQLLLIRREDFYLDDAITEGGVSLELAEQMQTFLVEFLPPDFDPNATEEPWQRTWDAPNQPSGKRMPVAVRVTVGRKDAAGRELTETVEFNLTAGRNL